MLGMEVMTPWILLHVSHVIILLDWVGIEEKRVKDQTLFEIHKTKEMLIE